MDSETARPPGDEDLPAADGAPTRWAARLTAPVGEGLMAISVIDSEEVFEAYTQLSEIYPSVSASTFFFTSMFS